MNLDCIKAADRNMGSGWIVIDTRNGGIVARDERDDDGFAWMRAAHKLSDALTEIERMIHATHPQQFAKKGK